MAACRDRVTDFLRSITSDITELLIKPDSAQDHVFPFVLRRRAALHHGVTKLDDAQIVMPKGTVTRPVELDVFQNGKDWAHLGVDKTGSIGGP